MKKIIKYATYAFIGFIFLLGVFRLTKQDSASPQSISYRCRQNKSALEVLKENADSIQTKQYSFGKQVVAINKQAQTKDTYWLYSVDGKEATVSADAYICQGSERIEWQLK